MNPILFTNTKRIIFLKQRVKKQLKELQLKKKTKKYQKDLADKKAKLIAKLIQYQYNENFDIFAISNKLRIGYWKVVCIICQEMFCPLETQPLVGYLSVCCEGFNYCGDCLAKVDFETFEKLSRGDICPCSKSNFTQNHGLLCGPYILNLNLEICIFCTSKKPMLESTHKSSITNSAMPTKVSCYKTNMMKKMEEYKNAHGREIGIKMYKTHHTEIMEVWNSQTQTMEPTSVMPYLPKRIESWILLAPTLNDPDRYVYDTDGKKLYFVKKQFPNDLDEKNLMPKYNGETPKVSWGQFLCLSPECVYLNPKDTLQMFYAVMENIQIRERNEINENIGIKKSKFHKIQSTLGVLYLDTQENINSIQCRKSISSNHIHETLNLILDLLYKEFDVVDYTEKNWGLRFKKVISRNKNKYFLPCKIDDFLNNSF